MCVGVMGGDQPQSQSVVVNQSENCGRINGAPRAVCYALECELLARCARTQINK